MASSYLIYLLTLVSSTLFAALAQKYSYKNKNGIDKPHTLFWLISMGILIFIMGFRSISVGVDDLSYYRNYHIANSMDVVQYYSQYTTEPGFYLLYRIVDFLFGDFQWLIIISSVITIFLFYKALEFEINNISLSIGVFIFTLTQYFYYFGIIRMGLAVAIVVYAYRYIILNQKKKYILSVLIATMFHYSALFSLVLLLVKINKEGIAKSNIIRVALAIPISFFIVRYLLYPFIEIDRYQGYVESTGVISYAFITSLPMLLLFIWNYKSLILLSKNHQLYYLLFWAKIVTEIFSPLIGISRMVWYINLSFCILLSGVLKSNNNYLAKYIIFLFTILYSFYYSYFAYFGDSHRASFMLPYENIFFSLMK